MGSGEGQKLMGRYCTKGLGERKEPGFVSPAADGRTGKKTVDRLGGLSAHSYQEE